MEKVRPWPTFGSRTAKEQRLELLSVPVYRLQRSWRWSERGRCDDRSRSGSSCSPIQVADGPARRAAAHVVSVWLQVETFVAVVGAGPVRRQIPFWVIALAIIGGCLLLFLIVIVLWKVRIGIARVSRHFRRRIHASAGRHRPFRIVANLDVLLTHCQSLWSIDSHEN